MKKYYLLATALAAMVSCTSDDYVGDNNLQEANGQAAISFGFDVPNATRASGATAASALDNQFIVWGEKKETSDAIPTDGNLVFPNYQVNYVASSALTTTSNTKNWEYVGFTHSSNYQSNITYKASSGDATHASNADQTIKYWDYSADTYTFTAISAKKSDIEGNLVTIQKNIQGTTSGSAGMYEKGYTITLKSGASADNLFIADRNVVSKPTSGTTTADRNTEAYGGYVKLTFRNLLAQVRVGLYETIPGYQVRVDNFYYATTANPAFSAMTTTGTGDDAKKFYANIEHQTATGFTSDITLGVTYKDGTTATPINEPITSVTGGNPSHYITLGDNIIGTTESPIYLGEDVAHVVYDQNTANTYTKVFPQESNSSNLKLKVDYTLYNSITKETIKVNGATAEIPAEYLQWKANYKYTYIFKISDNTNGYTNPELGPAGLYPITFDAVTIDAADGSEVQYITTVSDPSITTYQNAAITDEYTESAEEAIYIAVTDNTANPALILTGGDTNAKLYIATQASSGEVGAGTNPSQSITEASVANAIKNGTHNEGAKTYTVKDANKWNLVVTEQSTLTQISEIPAADSPSGANLTINGAKFTPSPLTADTYYVFEYTSVYTPVASGTAVAEGGKYYDISSNSYHENTAASATTIPDDGKQYYLKNESDLKKTYKIIKVKNVD